MDKFEAGQIVQNTLQNSFDKKRFIYFIKNLLNTLDETKAFQARGYVQEKYKQTTGIIKTYERIGTYTDPGNNKIDILIVYLEKENSIEKARTTLRNFAADYLKNRDEKEAGFFAFVAPNLKDWRLSFVKMEYHLEETTSGRIKAREQFTPAKRYSFLVGEEESSHTAQSRLAPIIQDDVNNPTLKQLEDAFDIEKVTNEFFEKYCGLFLDVKEALEKIITKNSVIAQNFIDKGVDPVDFSKKLLGQIVFLYFLQKKGWFGVGRDNDWGTGPKNFLRLLFEKMITDYENFFNNVLEPLFYEALAKERDDDFYSRFNCKVPFLNGGLFDPICDYDWVHTDICLPDELFSNKVKTKEGDTGTGILDIFDRYNFTVKEDEPLEKEVAVDPEMLGKVFENLLEVKDRKSKGTYYTPREIVHYMCQESLINYLVNEDEDKVNRKDIETLIQYGESAVEHDSRVEQEGKETPTYSYKLPEIIRKNAQLIDEKLKNIRVCDPAIGSGAFPVGMMNEIVRTRNTLTNYLEDKEGRSIYSFKRNAIQNSLYGVDIDPGAVEIAKLRLWLSLVVDEEDIKQIKPLPNLDYKIMQGNSLLEEFEGVKLFDDRLLNLYVPVNNDQIKKLEAREKEIQKDLMAYYQRNPSWMKNQKIERPTELYQLEGELKRVQFSIKDEKGFRFQIKDSNQNALFGDEQKARKIWEELQSLQKEFFETTQKKEKDELKKQVEKLEWELIEATLKEENKESSLKKLEQYKKSNIKPFFLWKLHFSEVFQEKGGFDVVIANPPYLGESGHKEVFREIKKGNLGKFYQGKMDIFYFFFHLALNLGRDNACLSFITTNYYLTASGAIKLRQDLKNRSIIKNLINFNELRIFESALGQHNIITILIKNNNQSELAYTSITKSVGRATASTLHNLLNRKDAETKYFKIQQNNLYEEEENYIRLEGNSNENQSPAQLVLLNIKKHGEPLDKLCNINQGIVTGGNFLTEKNKEKYTINDASVGDGIFILRKNEIQNLHLTPEEMKLIKPLYKNSDIRKYYTNLINDFYIINLKYTDRLNIDNYPNIKRHLLRFKRLLLDRPRTGTLESAFTNNYWYVMTTSRRLNFENPKIVVPYRSITNTFGFNEVPWYGITDIYFITKKDEATDLKYILALLNSKLYYLWLYYKGKRKGETLELFQQPLSEIPIKRISSDEQKPFIAIVEKILSITNSSDYSTNLVKQAKVSEYEKQIDQMVYKLYGLTPEEVEIVENKQ